ncbi:hypothetical protein AB4Z29_09725 [Paenibacillus sp. 2TAB23]|uniref:hypothetical protein n=1 Tax=Paenibacillus sp. 2TAB23 TaxID=3233004 RepID=UPI003F94FBD7
MLKRIGWLGKLVASGLILSFLCIWTTGYIVTSYVESILKQFNLPLEVPPMAMSGVWGKLWGADPLVTTDIAEQTEAQEQENTKDTSEAKTEDTPEAGNEDSPKASTENNTNANTEDKTEANAQQETEKDPPASVDAFSQASDPPLTDIGIGGGTQAGAGSAPDSGTVVEEGVAGIDGSETAMTTDELTEVKEQMSDKDKDELFGLLMSKLPQESWQTISQYIENGLTEQELTAIQQIMAQHLDKTEYTQMMDILKKY